MTTTIINSNVDWGNWDPATSSAILGSNLTFNVVITPKTIPATSTLDGAGHTISISNVSAWEGPIILNGGTIQDIVFVVTDSVLSINSISSGPAQGYADGFVLKNNSGSQSYGTLNNIMVLFSGTTTLGSSRGSFISVACPPVGKNLTFNQCYAYISMMGTGGELAAQYAGGYIGYVAASTGTTTINGSAVVVYGISQSSSHGNGGFVGASSSHGADSVCNINQSIAYFNYTTGTAFTNCGGFSAGNSLVLRDGYYYSYNNGTSNAITNGVVGDDQGLTFTLTVTNFCFYSQNVSGLGAIGNNSMTPPTLDYIVTTTNQQGLNPAVPGGYSPANGTYNYAYSGLNTANLNSGNWNFIPAAGNAPILSNFVTNTSLTPPHYWFYTTPSVPIIGTTTNSTAAAFNAQPFVQNSLMCLLEGTLIRTPQGERKIEDIREGDLISTARGDVRVVKIISREMIGSEENIPYLIPTGYYDGLPTENLYLSRYHAFHHNDKFHHVSCCQRHKQDFSFISTKFRYYHLGTSQYPDVMYANGLGVETCAVDSVLVRNDCSPEECKLWTAVPKQGKRSLKFVPR